MRAENPLASFADDESVGPFVRVFLSSLASHLAVFLFVHLPGFLADRGASEATIGASFAVTSLCAIAARPFVGWLMDVHGRRHALVLGGLLHVVASAAYLGIRDAGPMLFLVRGLHGIAGGIYFSAVFAVASDLAPDEVRTQRLSIFGISGILPMSLGAILGDFVLAHSDHATLFLLATVFAAIGLGLAATVPETRPTTLSAAPSGMLAALRAPGLAPLWLAGILFATAIASYFCFVRNFVSREHLGSVSHFFTPYAVTAIVVRVLFGWVPGRVGEENVFAPALLVLGAGLLTLTLAGTAHTTSHGAIAHGSIAILVAGFLCGFGHAFAFPTLMTMFVVRSDPAMRGSVVAMFTALMDIGILLSGHLFGHVADAFGFRVVFALSAVVAFSAFVLFVAFARKAPETSR